MEILLVLQVIVVVALIAVILVQKSGSDGFTGGGSQNSFLTGKASANLFTRITSILATIFIVNSLVLAYIASHTERAGSILEQAADEAAKENKTTKNTKGSLSDIEKKMRDMKTPNSQPVKTEQPVEQPVQENKPKEKSEGSESKTENPTDAPAEGQPTQQPPVSAPSVPVSE